MLMRPLRGVIPPLATPLRDPDTLDVAGLERLIEHVLSAGVSGLFLLGTTGEGPALSNRLRRQVIDEACRLTRKRVPVLVGVSDTSPAESVTLARHSADAGADAVVTAGPCYFRPAQPELLRYVRRLAQGSPLPLFLYNIPSVTRVHFAPETVRQATDIDSVIGIKDSSGDMSYFHALREQTADRLDFTLLIGPELLLGEAVLLGGHGGVAGGSNIHPRLFVEFYEAALRRDVERVAVLQSQVLRLGRLYQVGPPESSYLRGLKCALACLGLCRDVLAEPFEPFAGAERERIARLVAEAIGPAPSERSFQPAR